MRFQVTVKRMCYYVLCVVVAGSIFGRISLISRLNKLNRNPMHAAKKTHALNGHSLSTLLNHFLLHNYQRITRSFCDHADHLINHVRVVRKFRVYEALYLPSGNPYVRDQLLSELSGIRMCQSDGSDLKQHWTMHFFQ